MAGAASALAQSPRRMILGMPPGGSGDLIARRLVEQLAPLVGPIAVEHFSGAGGRDAAVAVRHAASDGHTLLLGSASMMAIQPAYFPHLAYDPVRDFRPLMNLAGFDLAVVAHRDVPARDWDEFVGWARGQAGRTRYGSYGRLTASHLLGEMILRAAGLQLYHLAYPSVLAAEAGLGAGEVPFICNTLASAMRLARAGQGRVLATSGRVRSRLLPDVPTLIELGLREVATTGWYALFAPAATPAGTLGATVGQLTTAVLAPAFRESLAANGLEPLAEGPVALAQTLRDDRQHWARVLRALNLQG